MSLESKIKLHRGLPLFACIMTATSLAGCGSEADVSALKAPAAMPSVATLLTKGERSAELRRLEADLQKKTRIIPPTESMVGRNDDWHF